MQHRKDIDGLRAIAVSSVVIFHAFPTMLTGGFVGVDVFFVISGFLITSILVRQTYDQKKGLGSLLLDFYDRRARRILPALVLMLAASTIFAAAILPPSELERYGKSLASVALFASNLFFWISGGYFGPAPQDQPLLHTWSLSVEEQFYIVWPFAIFVLSRFVPKRAAVWVVASAAAASLCLAQMRLAAHPNEVFFGFPARAWELLLGAVFAFRVVPEPRRKELGDVAVGVGLCFVVGSCLLLSEEVPFPGLAAAPACIGTALVIWGGPGSIFVKRPLELAPAQWVGKISYSLYLWHWPVLVFPRLWLGREMTWLENIFAIGAATIAAWLSWAYIEAPFRRTGQADLRLVHFARPLSVLGVVILCGGALLFSGGGKAIASQEVRDVEAAAKDVNPRRQSCHTEDAFQPLPLGEKCSSGASERRTLVWGDSHADGMTPGISAWAHSHGMSDQQLTMSACPPLLGVDVVSRRQARKGCRDFNDRVLNYIAEARPAYVVLAARWPRYVENAAGYGGDGGNLYLVDRRSGLNNDTSRRVFSDALPRTVSAIRRVSPLSVVVVIGSTPEFPLSVPTCFARRYRLSQGVEGCKLISRASYDERSGYVEKVIQNLPGSAAETVQLSQYMCSHDSCRSTEGGRLLFRDADHMSAEGARILLPRALDGNVLIEE